MLGVAAFSLLIDKDLTPLVPQPFVAVTVTLPDVNPLGKVNEILFVPCPVKPIAPGGTDQV